MTFFWNKCEEFGDASAVNLPSGDIITYMQLIELADKLLDSIKLGSLVAIECENHVDCVAAYLGCLRHKVVPLLIDGSLDSELRNSLYMRFSPQFVFQRTFDGSRFEWRLLHEKSPALHPDLALLLSTSGSTGSPRLVRLSRQNLQSNAESISKYLNISSNDRPITSLPMHYSYGLSVINSHIFSGACLLLTPSSVTEREFWSFFKEAGATSFSGVPTTYEILRRLRFERMELPSLRTLTQAGGRLAPEAVCWFGELALARNIKFVVMYGQTEATARISYLPSEHTFNKSGSIGIAIPGGKLLLKDASGEVIDDAGEVGELVYRGKNVMLGYAESAEELSAEDTQKGELATGDLARKDVDGFYYIVGRLKRFIKIHGNRFGLDEIEQRLHASGTRAYVTGRDDLLMVALVDEEVDSSALAKILAKEYQLHPSVIRVIPCSDIPMSTAGKVQYHALLTQIESILRER